MNIVSWRGLRSRWKSFPCLPSTSRSRLPTLCEPFLYCLLQIWMCWTRMRLHYINLIKLRNDRTFRRASRNQDDLSEGSRFHNFLVRARGVAERQFLANDGADRAAFKTCTEPCIDVRGVGVGNIPEREPAHGSAASHQIARHNRDFGAAADYDHPPVAREELEIVPQIDLCGHFQDDVDAAPVRRDHNFFMISRVPVVECMVRAFAPHKFKPFVRARRSDHRHTHGAGDLHRGNSYAAARSVHQQRFGGVRFRLMVQRVVSRAASDINARALLK